MRHRDVMARLLAPPVAGLLALALTTPALAADSGTPAPTASNRPPARAALGPGPSAPSGTPGSAPTVAAVRPFLSADTEIASVVPGQPGQPTQVMITSGLGEQLAIASFRPAGAAISTVAAAPPVMAAGRVFWADATGMIWSLAAHTPAAVAVATLPAILPNTRLTLAVAPDATRVFASAVTVPGNPTAAADERLFSIAVGSSPIMLARRADPSWYDGGVPDLIGWDGAGPIEVRDANLLARRPERGHAVHLDPVSGDIGDPIGGTTCVLVSQTRGGSSLCGDTASLVFNVLGSTGKRFWKVPAPDGWIDQFAQLSPDAGRIVTADHVVDYLGTNRGLPSGFTAAGWVDATHVLGVADATHVLAIVDITRIERVNPIAAQGQPLGVVAPDDIVSTDPPAIPPQAVVRPKAAPPAMPPAPANRTRLYLLATVAAIAAAGFLYYRKNTPQVDGLIANLRGKYKQHEEEAKRKRAEELWVAPKPKPPGQTHRPAYRVAVRGPDFSAGLDAGARGLVMHDPQSFSDFVLRWLAQDSKGQEFVAEATPDLPAGASREDRLERGAQRLAMSQTFSAISRSLIVPWLSSTRTGVRRP